MRWVRYPCYLFGKICALAFIFVGGGLLAITGVPISTLFAGTEHERTQFLIHNSFRFYIRMLQFFRLIRLDIEGADKLVECGGKLVIANHPSLLDVVILMSLIPKVQCIVKHELWNHHLLCGLMRRAGYIRNDLDPEKLVASCKASLEEGRSLIIFPEGTRTLPGALPHFYRGFANVATLTKASIQMVVITCHPPFLYKGEPWWRIPPRTPYFQVVFGECLDAETYSLYAQRGITARKLVESSELYYASQMRNKWPRVGT